MLNKTLRRGVVCIAGVAIAGTAMAEDASVTTGASSMKVGGELQAAWTHSDNGYEKTDDNEPDAHDVIMTHVANVNLHGKINSKAEYGIQLNLLANDWNQQYAAAIQAGAPAASFLDYAWASSEFGPVSVTVGRQYVFQGGWDNMRDAFDSAAKGNFMGGMTRSRYEDAVTVGMDVAGTLSLQLLNDVTTANGGSWNARPHPTFVLNWAGQKFGPVSPIITYGTQDNQKTTWMDIGVKTAMAGLDASLDYSTVSWGAKTADGDSFKNEVTTATTIALNVAYEIKGTATPFFYLASFDKVQAGEDSKVNTAGMRDDNGMTWALGADLDMVGGKNYLPYFKIVSNSGVWTDASDADKEETKTEMDISLGVNAWL